MAAKRWISDEDLAVLRQLFQDEGWTLADLAEEFDLSPQHVGRLVRGERRAPIGGLDPEALQSGVCAAVDAWLAGVELDKAGSVLAATTRALAAKLDACAASDSATAAQAAPRIASELIDAVEKLNGSQPGEPDALDDMIRQRRARRLAQAGQASAPRG